MNLRNVLEQIESVRFAVDLNIASGFRPLLQTVSGHEFIRQLAEKLRQSPENKQEVFMRLHNLLKDNPNPEYAHPHDTAVTGYLYALSLTEPTLAHLACKQVLRTPQLWWARKLARHLLEHVLETGSAQMMIGPELQQPHISGISTAAGAAGSDTFFPIPEISTIDLVDVSTRTSSSKDEEQGSAAEVGYLADTSFTFGERVVA